MSTEVGVLDKAAIGRKLLLKGTAKKNINPSKLDLQ